ncbi:MAG: hypothetical protein WBG50_11415 [Desulfomonilaceae bacterium]
MKWRQVCVVVAWFLASIAFTITAVADDVTECCCKALNENRQSFIPQLGLGWKERYEANFQVRESIVQQILGKCGSSQANTLRQAAKNLEYAGRAYGAAAMVENDRSYECARRSEILKHASNTEGYCPELAEFMRQLAQPWDSQCR